VAPFENIFLVTLSVAGIRQNEEKKHAKEHFLGFEITQHNTHVSKFVTKKKIRLIKYICCG
jgi:hypothetical protein